MAALSRKRLIDKLVEAYVDWREASVQVDDAYRASARETGPWAQSRSGCMWPRSTLRSRLPTPTPGWSAAPRSSPGPQEPRLEPFGEPAGGLDSAPVDAQYESE